MATAWYGEPKLKEAAMERLREHHRMNRLVQGTYWEDGRGCHLGCLTHRHSDAQAATERMFGIPLQVAYWLEAVFEGLPADEAPQWVLDSTEAIPVGADLSLAHYRFCAWLLDPETGMLTITDGNRQAIADVRRLNERAAAGETVTPEEWAAARAAARAAAGAAAGAAAWAAAGAAARAAAGAAAGHKIAAKSSEIFRTSPVVGRPDECPACVGESLAALRADRLMSAVLTD